MKRLLVLITASSLLLGNSAWGSPPASPAFVTTPAGESQPYRLFGGREVILPVVVHAPEIERLTFRGRLFQRASTLMAPIGEPIPLSFSVEAEQRPALETELAVALPAVTREGDFEVRIQCRLAGDDAWHPAGRISLRLYPDDLLGPLRSWAGSHRLRVEDAAGTLTAFLREHDIAIATSLHRGSDDRAVTLLTGKRARQERSLRRTGRVVAFAETEKDTPHFTIERTPTAVALTVEMRLLDRLRDHPPARKALVEIFELLQNER